VHGYDHVDFRSLSIEDARKQFDAAVQVFQKAGIEVSGFRCPYLSYDSSQACSLPPDIFHYSSNKAVWWELFAAEKTGQANAIFRTLQSFYNADSADTGVVTPRLQGSVVEIPASVPDDLQLCDGMKLGPQGMADAWREVLARTHRRGEIFTLLFHPESFLECGDALVAILAEARDLHPSVWITLLKDVGEWWHEKAAFRARAEKVKDGYQVNIKCSPRATVLVRDLPIAGPAPWSDSYDRLASRSVFVPGAKKPFIGVQSDTDPKISSLLREQGFIVEADDLGCEHSLYLTASQLEMIKSERQLIDFIENQRVPLIRFGCWPGGTKSALCITGDLDALCLVDYIQRLLPRPRSIH